MTQEKREAIRKYLNAEKIVVHNDGRVDAYGNASDPYDRDMDWWRFAGWSKELLREIKEGR